MCVGVGLCGVGVMWRRGGGVMESCFVFRVYKYVIPDDAVLCTEATVRLIGRTFPRIFGHRGVCAVRECSMKSDGNYT